jgi:hypothetical protein
MDWYGLEYTAPHNFLVIPMYESGLQSGSNWPISGNACIGYDCKNVCFCDAAYLTVAGFNLDSSLTTTYTRCAWAGGIVQVSLIFEIIVSFMLFTVFTLANLLYLEEFLIRFTWIHDFEE